MTDKTLQEVPVQPVSKAIWGQKYQLKDAQDNPVDGNVLSSYKRVARALADVEPKDRAKHYEDFVWAMQNGAIPAGRIMSNAGSDKYKPSTSTINCTVSDTIEDSMDGIMRAVHEAALTLAAGCVSADTTVLTEKGIVTAEQAVLEEHTSILAYNRQLNKFEMCNIEDHLTTIVPQDENIKITSQGTELITSKKHPVLVYREGELSYIRAGDINLSDAVVHYKLAYEQLDISQEIEDKAWFTGAHLGDGSAYLFKKEYKYDKWKQLAEEKKYPRTIFKMRSAEREVVQKYADYFTNYHGSNVAVIPTQTSNGTPVWDYLVNSDRATLAVELIDHQIGKKSGTLFVPAWIKNNLAQAFIPFLAGLVDTDGYISKESGAACIFMKNPAFAEELCGLLKYFNVNSSKTVCQYREHEQDGHMIKGGDGVVLKINDHNFLTVLEKYMVAIHKKEILNQLTIADRSLNRYVITMELRHALEHKYKKISHLEKQEAGFYFKKHLENTTSAHFLNKWSRQFPDLAGLIEVCFQLRPIENIESGLDIDESFYDFQVAKYNNYLAGNNGMMVIHNCGIGYCFSTLRPKGAFVNGAGATTSGALSFMDIYDAMCFTVSSAGGRRGAQMGTLDIRHPDVEDFISAKREDGRLRQFNLSLLITNDFINAVKEDLDWQLIFPNNPLEATPLGTVYANWPCHPNDLSRYTTDSLGNVLCKVYKVVKARYLWDLIMESTYNYSEPGFLLIDEANDKNNNWFCEEFRATNPCVTGDTLVDTDKGLKKVKELVGDTQFNVVVNDKLYQVISDGFFYSGDKRTYTLKLNNGMSVKCTKDHKIKTTEGWVAAEDLNKDHQVVLSKHSQMSVSSDSFTSNFLSLEESGVESVYDCTVAEIHCFSANGIIVHNCAEEYLPPHGSCLLGSVNLTKFVIDPFSNNPEFDWEKYKKVIAIFSRLLDNVVDDNRLPLPEQRHELETKRRHGMGFTGLGSTLTMMTIKYGSEEAQKFAEKISKVMAVESFKASVELAKEKGMAEFLKTPTEMTPKIAERLGVGYEENKDKKYDTIDLYLSSNYYLLTPEAAEEDSEIAVIQEAIKEHGVRYSHATAIAPTGTISLSLANNASNGVEPSFSHEYFRNVIIPGKSTKQQEAVYSYEYLAYKTLIDPDATIDTLPDYFVTADDITPREHVLMQAACQKWIDTSISKTVNVPTNIPFQEFKDVYMLAVEKGLKGCTTFRFNPEVFQGVLVKEDDLENTVYSFVLEDGSTIDLAGNEEVEYEGDVTSAANLYDALKEGYYGKF